MGFVASNTMQGNKCVGLKLGAAVDGDPCCPGDIKFWFPKAKSQVLRFLSAAVSQGYLVMLFQVDLSV